MGSMRFTDVERSIMFASTDMPGLSKDKLLPTGAKSSQVLRTKPHYSTYGKGFWLWGTQSIYTNNFVSRTSITFHTEYTGVIRAQSLI